MKAELSHFASEIFKRTYAAHPNETWGECAARVAKAVALNRNQERAFFQVISQRKFVPGGRYLATAGKSIFQCSNCFGFVAEDTREGWAQLLYDTTMCLSMGGGVGITYSGLRPKGAPIKRMGGESSGPLALMKMINEVARNVLAGGKRRSALWGGLSWQHPDLQDFVSVKDWDQDIKDMKAKKFDYPAPLDMVNVSVIIDSKYLSLLNSGDPETERLHNQICDYMLRTGEPGFLNMARRLYDDPHAVTTNACTESTLHPHDTCNLGSVVLPRINDLTELEFVVRTAVQFLYNGSMIGDYPLESIRQVAIRNRRIGLGLMGLHEFMLINGHKYEWFDKLESFLKTWKDVSDDEAVNYASRLGGNRPVARRAVAPTGTISICAEVTSGIEPIFCKAYKRRYIDNGQFKYQYVVDPSAKRLLELGVDPKLMEDAYSLSHDVHRRLDVNAKVQEYTDQAISSTINLPEYGSITTNEFSALMKEYLPRLKGITTYPENSRSGQPLSPCAIEEAMEQEGVVFEESGECKGGVCGL